MQISLTVRYIIKKTHVKWLAFTWHQSSWKECFLFLTFRFQEIKWFSFTLTFFRSFFSSFILFYSVILTLRKMNTTAFFYMNQVTSHCQYMYGFFFILVWKGKTCKYKYACQTHLCVCVCLWFFFIFLPKEMLKFVLPLTC